MGFSLDKWYADKKIGDVVLELSGSITNELIGKALVEMEEQMNLKKETNQIRKRVFNVFVECLQNLYHHIDKLSDLSTQIGNDSFGAIILSKIGSTYRISTGNFIKVEKVTFIKDRIDQINSLSDNELKMLYRDILNNNEFSIKGGGGLGMLDIVRKTGNKLEYYFYPYSDNLVFFALDVYIC